MRIFAAATILIPALILLPAAAAPLYVGNKEIDTTDIEALRNLVAHCERLDRGADNADAGIAGAPDDMAETSPWPVASTPGLEPSSIAVDHLIMPDSGSSEGEDGDDAPVSEDDEEEGEADAVDLAAIEREDCKSAGILH